MLLQYVELEPRLEWLVCALPGMQDLARTVPR
jgi:hypothetical protein